MFAGVSANFRDANIRQNDEQAESAKTGHGDDEREHLTGLEVEKLLAATKGARHEARDRCLILLMFRHGLRVSEAVGLKLSDVDLEGAVSACEAVEARLVHDAAVPRG